VTVRPLAVYAPPALSVQSPTEVPYRAAHEPERPSTVEGTLFPAGAAVSLLGVGFFVTRVFTGLAAGRGWLGKVGAFCAVAGALLALAASFRLTFEASASRGRPGAFVGRALALVPVTVLTFGAALSTTLSQRLQLLALTGVTATLLAAGFRGMALAASQRNWLALATLGTLVLGEGIELALPVISMASASAAMSWRWVLVLGRVGELCAFAGVALATGWSVLRTTAAVGRTRVLAFLAMPVAFAALVMTLPARFPRTTESVARGAFGARFDLTAVAGAGHPSREALIGYSLLFSGLVVASSVSLAGVGNDRGAGVRRALAWMSLLYAGFGAVSLSGVLDPLRAVALTLGVLLLEQAVAQERV